MSSISKSRRSKRKLLFSNEENKKIKSSGSAVWSEEDEVSLLKAMIDYEVTQQANPYDDMGKFLDFVRPSLHFNVQRKQLTDKLWKLKKFLNSKYDSTNPHHANLFELSNSIKSWGQHANVSLDDDHNVEEANVVVDDVGLDKLVEKLSKVVENEKQGKLVGSDGQNAKKGKSSKKKGKLVDGEGQNNKKDDMIVEDVNAGEGEMEVKDKSKGDDVTYDDEKDDFVIDDVDKSSKVVENGKLVGSDGQSANKGKCSKKKGKVVDGEGQKNKKDDMIVEDANAGEGELVIKDKSKGDDVTYDDQNVEDDFVVDDVDKSSKVDKSGKKGKIVTCGGPDGKEDNLAIDEDVCFDKASENEKKGKLASTDGQNAKKGKCSKKKGKVVDRGGQNNEKDDMLVEDANAGKGERVVKDKSKRDVVTYDDQNVEKDFVVDDVDKSSKVDRSGKKGKLASNDGQNAKKGKCSKKAKVVDNDGQNNKKDDMIVEDANAGEGVLVVKDKSKGDEVAYDDQNVEDDFVVDDVDKSFKVDRSGKKGKIVTCGGTNGKEVNVAIDDVRVDKALEVVKKKKKLVTRDGESFKEAEVVLDDVNAGRYSKKKGNSVNSDGQNNEEGDVVVGDVDAENVVTCADQNVKEDIIANAVVGDVHSPKKNGKKRVKVLGDENLPKEVSREYWKDFTSMFPELTSMLELETLSWMPQCMRKKCVIDTINSMGWEKANELEKEWADVRLIEMELKAKKFDLTNKQRNLILEAKRREFKP